MMLRATGSAFAFSFSLLPSLCSAWSVRYLYFLSLMPNESYVQQEAHVICLFILALLLLSIANDGEYTESSATRSTLAFSYIACKSLNTNNSTGIWNKQRESERLRSRSCEVHVSLRCKLPC